MARPSLGRMQHTKTLRSRSRYKATAKARRGRTRSRAAPMAPRRVHSQHAHRGECLRVVLERHVEVFVHVRLLDGLHQPALRRERAQGRSLKAGTLLLRTLGPWAGPLNGARAVVVGCCAPSPAPRLFTLKKKFSTETAVSADSKSCRRRAGRPSHLHFWVEWVLLSQPPEPRLLFRRLAPLLRHAPQLGLRGDGVASGDA